MKAKIKKEPIRKVRNILKSKLNEGNINAIVINRARIVSWTKVELEDGTWRARSGNKKDHDRQCMWHSTLKQMLMDCTCRDVR